MNGNYTINNINTTLLVNKKLDTLCARAINNKQAIVGHKIMSLSPFLVNFRSTWAVASVTPTNICAMKVNSAFPDKLCFIFALTIFTFTMAIEGFLAWKSSLSCNGCCHVKESGMSRGWSFNNNRCVILHLLSKLKLSCNRIRNKGAAKLISSLWRQ